MEYFIDPVNGSDENHGMRRAAAWRGFKRLAGIRLEAGDRVAIFPGTYSETLELHGAGSATAPVEVHLAAGRYDFFSADARREVFNISNCNAEPGMPKALGILVRGSAHVQISGAAAVVVFHGKMIELCVDDSEAVTVTGLSFDYARPTVSEFTVVGATATQADLRVHPDSTYRVVDGSVEWLGEDWRYTTGLAQELIPATGVVWRRRDPLVGLRVEELSPFLLRVHGRHDLVAGRVIQLRNPHRDGAGVFIRHSREVVLREMKLFYLHGLGVLGQFSEDLTFDGVRIAPAAGSGRTTAAWADCMHFSGCRGRLLISNCAFCGAHDDAVNVHGTFLRIIDQLDDRRLRVRFMHRQTYGFPAFHAGDEIAFVRWDTLAVFGENRVVAAELIGPREMLLTLASPAPAGRRTDDVVENLTWTPTVEIRDCRVSRLPTRGFLVTTPRPALIHGNHFERLNIGVQVEVDARKWFESGGVRDLVIAGNRFVECRRSAIRIFPECHGRNCSVHRNVRIVENTIVAPAGGRALEISGTDGLEILGNRIQPPAGGDAGDLVEITDCENVTCDEGLF